jgi:hypothetical protein
MTKRQAFLLTKGVNRTREADRPTFYPTESFGRHRELSIALPIWTCESGIINSPILKHHCLFGFLSIQIFFGTDHSDQFHAPPSSSCQDSLLDQRPPKPKMTVFFLRRMIACAVSILHIYLALELMTAINDSH